MNNSVGIADVFDINFGNCKRIFNDKIELLVTLDFGPRIISFLLKGEQNIFFQDLEKQVLAPELSVYKGDAFRLYGGHRLWVSPEVLPRCYHPDNMPVSYELTKNGIKFFAKIEKHTGIQKSLDISINESSEVLVVHSIKNCGMWDIRLAAWAITMLAANGMAVMPIPKQKSGLLPNQKFVFWEYADINDERFYKGNNFLTLKQQEGKQPFKVGTYNYDGWAAYINCGQIFFKFFDEIPNADYPDMGCNFETYTNSSFLEIETLSGLKTIAPGEEVRHLEQWKIFKQDFLPKSEEEMDAVVTKHVAGQRGIKFEVH